MVTGQSQEQMQAILEKLQAEQLAEGIPPAEVRRQRIQTVIDMLVDNQDALAQALDQDYGGRHEYLTRMSEVMQSIGHLKDAKKKLHKWMKPEKRQPLPPMGLFGAKAQLRYQPKGVIGIMSPWNYPIAMVINPLATALAAGNRVMVKPSEFNPKTAELLEQLFSKYFPGGEVTVVNGGPETGAAFAALPLNHIIFTGATGIGRKVMEAAARNLTPVTLELGGKSPVIISRTADIAEAAARIMNGKATNAGQACVSPDYVFVPEESMETFIDACRAIFREQFPTALDNQDYSCVVNDRHCARITGYIHEAQQAGVRVENLGTEEITEGKRRIPVHIVVDPGEDLAIMQEEIFGPAMIVKPYQKLEPCVDYINQRPSPLALYYFGKDKAEQAWVLDHTLSGGVTVNEVLMHVACTDMPFGGVGASGIGNYHGREGFRTFSHARSVFTEGWLNIAKLAGTLPPYSDKVGKMLASQIKK